MSPGSADVLGHLHAPGIDILQVAARVQGPSLIFPFHQILLPDGSPWCDQYRTNDGYLLRYPGLADFTVTSGGDSISCCAVPGTDEATLLHLLQNQVMPLALSRQGRLLLHASAVAVDDRALAFVGESGRGKSTLAAAFAAQGHAFLTDDGLQLMQVGDQIQVLPGPPALRLWEDAREALVTAAPAATAVQYTPKFRLLADATLRHCGEACPMAAIYFLGDADVDEISISPMGGQEVLLALLQHCFLLDLEARTLLGRTFTTTAELVRTIQGWWLDYPRRFETLPAVIETVRVHARTAAAQQAKSD